MSIYLSDIPLRRAQLRFQKALEAAGRWQVLGVETVPLNEHALGRVLAGPIWAKISSPHYHAAAMDGFAVRAERTIGAQPHLPLMLPVGDSRQPSGGQAHYVDTGDPLPAWANAVIPIENAEPLNETGGLTADIRGPKVIRIRAAVAPWSHVRPLGEDIVATQLVLPAGHVLRPADLGAVAAAGYVDLAVARKPRVAILPTGSELVQIGSSLQPGDILEYNSIVMAAQIIAMGGEATRFPVCKDDFDLISQQVRQAAREYDLVLLNAGSSAGAEDFSAKVIEGLGELLVHGVAVRPGHPVIMGLIQPPGGGISEETGRLPSEPENPLGRVPIVGVPGYPVSAALTLEIFVEPILAKWLGRRPAERMVTTAHLTRKITSPPGDDDYVRVALGKVGDRLLAAPLSRGAGVITSLVQADGIVVLPAGTQGVEAGEQVSVQLYRSVAELERTILCIGSHDLILDLLAQYLAEYDRRFVSSNAGSQGGLVALRRREAHLAGSHLFDPETRDYNIPYIRQYMPGIPVKVVALARREQGLIVQRGNPKQIRRLADLTRPAVSFVNRQPGAGTRVLLDFHLNALGITPESIQGYNEEEYTHLGVAAAVSSGRADCGLGIAAAAQALELDFVPMFHERYDLVMPRAHAESDLLSPLFKVMERQDFRNAVLALKGYDVSVMGTVILEDV
jgi:putative molybdopterin biosynthesis protein